MVLPNTTVLMGHYHCNLWVNTIRSAKGQSILATSGRFQVYHNAGY